MARPIRVEFEGAVYHVTARGNERQRVFRTREDYELYLLCLEQCVTRFGLRLHGFCLMPNHFHLLLETPQGNLSRAMGWLQTTYTVRFNRRHRRAGHLFQGRYKALLVEADAYAVTLLRYVHLNPARVRSKTLTAAERREALEKFRWSSHRYYAGRARAPGWVCTDWLGFFAKERREAQREYGRFVLKGLEETPQSPWEKVRAGLVLGGEGLFERVRGLIGSKKGKDETAWVRREEDAGGRAAAARVLAQRQAERKWRAWVLARLGGLRGVDVARELGYKDGSAVTQGLKRLEAKKAAHTERMERLEGEFGRMMPPCAAA